MKRVVEKYVSTHHKTKLIEIAYDINRMLSPLFLLPWKMSRTSLSNNKSIKASRVSSLQTNPFSQRKYPRQILLILFLPQERNGVKNCLCPHKLKQWECELLKVLSANCYIITQISSGQTLSLQCYFMPI
jgi:hypothetical protein